MLRYCTFLLHLHTHVMLRYCTFLLHFHTHVMLRYCTFLLHLHTHVMLRYCTFLLHFHTHVMQRLGRVGGVVTFKYTSTHKSCYATVRSSCTCTHTSCYVCGNTYTSSSTDITIKTRNPSCSGWKTSFAYFGSSGPGPGMMIHTKHCKYQVKCSILIDFFRVLRRRVTMF